MRNIALLACLLLAACSSQESSPAFYFTRHDLPQPTLNGFPHCRASGCTKVDTVKLHPDDVAPIKKLFPAKNAAAERRQIAKAIGMFETKVGGMTGTSRDKGNSYSGDMFQQDCIDESTNTTVYLSIMQQQGWLKYHDTLAPMSRPPLFSGRFGPHRTGQIEDKKTHIRYAVDSWFHDNGHPAEIVNINTWKRGWHPAED